MTQSLLQLASSQLTRGRPQEALATLARLEATELEAPAPWVVRIAAFVALEKWEEARAALRHALSRWPENVPLRRMGATIAWQRGDAGQAEAHYLAALREAPESPDLLCGYAVMLAASGQMEKAHALVERAAGLDPEHDAVLHARWVLANLAGNDVEAQRLAKARVARSPDDPDALAALAAEFLYVGQHSRARRAFGASVRADVAAARDSQVEMPLRIATHWALVPLIPLRRYGLFPVALAGIIVVNVAVRLGPGWLGLPLAGTWFLYCIYSWVAPPLVEWHVRRSLR